MVKIIGHDIPKNNPNITQGFGAGPIGLKGKTSIGNSPEDKIRYDSGDSLWGLISGKDAEYRNFLYNKLATEYQNKQEWKMWRANNAYNTTAEQLKRWLQAGGTAASFFAAQAGATASQAPSAASQAGTASYSNGTESLNALANTANTAMNSYWEMQKKKAETEKLNLENGKFNEMTDAMIQERIAHVKLMEHQGQLTKAQATQISELLPYLKKKSEAEIDELKERANLLIEQQKTQKRQRWLMKKEGEKLNWDTKVSEYNSYKLQWENEFRNKWGIDPSQSGWSALIKSLASGAGENTLTKLFQVALGSDEAEIPSFTPRNFFSAIKENMKFLKYQSENYKPWDLMQWYKGAKKAGVRF